MLSLSALRSTKLTARRGAATTVRAVSRPTEGPSNKISGGRIASDIQNVEAGPELEPPREVGATAPVGTIARPEDSARSEYLVEAAASFLREELPRMFTTGAVTRSKYASDIVFQDPISSYNDLDGYSFNIAMLHRVFDVNFELFDIAITAPDTIETRWSMDMRFKLLPLPWKPAGVFTGITIYKVDLQTGLIKSHIDKWDAVKNNNFLSLEALQFALKSFTSVRLTPQLETPDYVILYKTPTYEIRRYDSYTVAEVTMPAGSGPAGGAGFTDLAGYIFGGNEKKVSMEMTTPVYSTGGQAGPDSNKMQFVMERRFAQDKLPAPNSEKISTKVEGECIRAAYGFSGFPLDYEVFQAEKALRDALTRDNIEHAPGYVLARYNEPTIPPFLKRNEVLIDLPNYKLPSL